MTAALIIPFRDRGVDPLRAANLARVLKHWDGSGIPVQVVDDGRDGAAHFNRSRAYNRGAAATDADVLVYIESDILIDYQQLRDAIALAAAKPGLVVPFTRQLKLTRPDSELVRATMKDAGDCRPDYHPYGEDSNNGCANVISRETLALAGRWDEEFEGHGHDDTAMYIAFRVCAGPARRVDGPAYHLFHLDADPDTALNSNHLDAEDVAAQERNRRRLMLYRHTRNAEEIRLLTAGGDWRKQWGQLNWRIRALAGD